MFSWFNGETTYDSKGQLVKSFYFNKTGVLRYEKERSIVNPPTVIKGIASTKNGSTTLSEIFSGEQRFDFPKPYELIRYILELTTSNNDIVLDSFAGSGTTGRQKFSLFHGL